LKKNNTILFIESNGENILLLSYIITFIIIEINAHLPLGLNIFLFGNIYRYKDNTHI